MTGKIGLMEMGKGNLKTKNYALRGLVYLDKDSYEYLINDEGDEANITNILIEAANNKQKVVYILIEMDGKLQIDEEGFLYCTPDEDNVMAWQLGDKNIDKFLFNHTGKHMNIYIKIIDSTEVVD